MSDDVEKRLGNVTPRGAPPELRARILDRVADALAEPGGSGATGVSPVQLPQHGRDARGTRRLDTRIAWAVVAALLLAVGLNFAAVRFGDARLAAYVPKRPEPVSAGQVAAALARLGDRGFDVLEDQLAAARWSRSSRGNEIALGKYQKTLSQYISILKEPIHAASQEDSDVDVQRRRRAGGDCSGYQRLPGLDQRRTA